MPENTDIIHSNSWNGFVFANSSTPLVTTVLHWVHDPVYKPYKGFLQFCYHNLLIKSYETLSINRSSSITAISQYTSRQVEKNFPGKKVKVITTGIDTELFKPVKVQENNSDKFKLVFVGSPSRRKGFDLLGPIMGKLGSDYLLYHTDGTINDTGNIVRTGRLNLKGLVDLYNQADVVLFPSRYEGFGYAVAEGMACGKPVVTTNISALPELIEDKKDGILCEVDDVQGFVNAIISLKEDKNRLIEMGEAARVKIVSNFSLEVMIDRYISHYRELLGHH